MSNLPPFSSRLRPSLAATFAVLTTLAVVTGLVHLLKRDFRRQSHLINVSLQAMVGVGGRPMIAGFVIADHSQTVVVRALGPSVARPADVAPLTQPRLRIVRNRDGVDVAMNEGWRVAANERLERDLKPYAPPDPREAACVLTLPAGAYSAVIESRDGSPGLAGLEIFVLLD
ncbi:MAG: hypothetical protein Q7S40_06685 [Opitutaceae bacterium]|nr:hypothetical protein [Opitutaceae bacterium]